MSLKSWLIEKLNPAQRYIAEDSGDTVASNEIITDYYDAYRKLEVVRNSVDRVVNGATSFNFDITDKLSDIPGKVRQKKLETLLNVRPNPYQDISRFRRSSYMDFLLDGNIFWYFDGAYLYHLPAINVEILTDDKTFVKGYRYNSKIEFSAEEVIHISENSADSIYRGTSRLSAAKSSMDALKKMHKFQEKFFENGTIPGVVIRAKTPMGDKAKDRLLMHWAQRFSPMAGGRRPIILDADMDIKNLMDKSFAELDYSTSIKDKEEAISIAVGVPYLLLRGGNNANISPNLRLFYLETVYPITKMVASAVESYFGYDVEPLADKLSALQPDMKESSGYYTTLVNGGVLTPNEARLELRYPKIEGEDNDKLRVPANIAGSASDPSQGGKPPSKEPK